MTKQAHRGAQRVEIGAKCKAGACHRCTVQDCKHDCHTREFNNWDQADAHRTTTGRPLRYEAGRFLVLILMVLGAGGCAALRDYSAACSPVVIQLNGKPEVLCQPVTLRSCCSKFAGEQCR